MAGMEKPIWSRSRSESSGPHAEKPILIEISPCPDPGGLKIDKTIKSKFSLGEEKEAELSMDMTNGLSLPINTFSGIIQ
ncbi:hypothetical protein JZ751_013349 [Albula glossodonta]|uniref:Uncharacterized protein n=1 Tax=Albula glossodonta TaxID=121402 RepID=A0A8T2NXB6_9TELE|nr:hypothetical protein JZ751_013349 [Albula glossodonta]